MIDNCIINNPRPPPSLLSFTKNFFYVACSLHDRIAILLSPICNPTHLENSFEINKNLKKWSFYKTLKKTQQHLS